MSSKRKRGLSDRLLASGLIQTFGLDALLVAALGLIGAGIYRLAHEAVWIYAGLVALLAWWAIGKSRGAEKPKA